MGCLTAAMPLPAPMVMASPRPSPDRPGLTPAVWEVIDRIAATSRGAGWCRSDVRVSIVGVCPTRCRVAVLRIVDELATNAAEHAVVGQQPGRLIVMVESCPVTGVMVTVGDDGEGFRPDVVVEGNGLRLLRLLGAVSVTCASNRCLVQCRLRPCIMVSGTTARRAEVLA